jgi:hypothetical protein
MEPDNVVSFIVFCLLPLIGLLAAGNLGSSAGKKKGLSLSMLIFSLGRFQGAGASAVVYAR